MLIQIFRRITMNTLSKNILASIILALSVGAISTTLVAGQDGNQLMLIQQTIAKLQAKQKAQAEAQTTEADKLTECKKQLEQTQNKGL